MPGRVTQEREIIPSLVEGLFVFDREGRLVRLNPSGERILGRSERMLLGKGAGEVFPHNPELAEAVGAALSERKTVAHIEVPLRNLKGEELILSFSLSPTEDAEGGVQGAILLARDETLLRQLDSSFRKADQLASLGILAAGFAHEIKNPLGGIKGATQLLRMELPDPSPLAEHCDIILREVERVDSLLERLLDLTPREDREEREFDIHAVLEEVAALAVRMEGAGNRISRNYDPSLPLLLGEPHALHQVFLNLVKNALEASPPGTPVTLSTGHSPGVLLQTGLPRGPGAVEVTVEDEGGGFPPEVAAFRPFFTTKPQGVGLGLVISEQIVHAHGGRLLLENREEGGRVTGARARVVLPLRERRKR